MTRAVLSGAAVRQPQTHFQEARGSGCGRAAGAGLAPSQLALMPRQISDQHVEVKVETKPEPRPDVKADAKPEHFDDHPAVALTDAPAPHAPPAPTAGGSVAELVAQMKADILATVRAEIQAAKDEILQGMALRCKPLTHGCSDRVAEEQHGVGARVH